MSNVKCPDCNGTGYYHAKESIICGTCDGFKYVDSRDIIIDEKKVKRKRYILDILRFVVDKIINAIIGVYIK